MIKDIRKYWIIKLLLYPFSFIYGLITDCRNIFYDHRFFRTKEYNIPIISIGNIIAGGTGKTPFTMLCIDLLRIHYQNIVIVSRGYGRDSKGVLIVSDGQGNSQPAQMGGDEPVMIAKKYPDIPVVVAEARTEGIDLAIMTFDTDLIILDDAFQHRRVARCCDIVLLNGKRSLSAEELLPVGDLREKIRNLGRADIVVVNKSYGDPTEEDLKLLDSLFKGPIYECIFRPTVLVNTQFQKTDDISALTDKKVYAFTAIANPEQFKYMLTKIGADVLKLEAFPDHYYYSSSDLKKIRNDYQTMACQYLVTTEKDLVKIDPDIFKDLNLVGVGLGGQMGDQGSFVEKLNQYVDIKF